MKKNIVVISSSLRKGSNSEMLADKFIEGARDSGHQVEKVNMQGKAIGFCKGCLGCQKAGKCVIQDDSNEIVRKMLSADSIVFATPIYYYEMSGQMKTMLDRANPLFFLDYKFRDIYLLTTAADEDAHAEEGALNGLNGWISCFAKAYLSGTVFAGGVDETGEIQHHPALQIAYQMGKDA